VRLSFVPFVGFILLATCHTYDVTYTDDGGACTGVCNGMCVDLQTDPKNCGACGVVCSPTSLCAGDAGGCEPCQGVQPAVCGQPGGQFCADLSNDNHNCGACSNVCGDLTQCVSGQCVCGATTCGTACVDLQTDVNHCGGCDTPCTQPPSSDNEIELCSAGHCTEQCIAPFADCDNNPTNGCETNLQTSPTSCGVCSRTCNGGTCMSGLCVPQMYATGSNLVGLAVDSSFVYWADGSSGVISKAPIGGGSAQTVYAASSPVFLAVDATRIVWMQSSAVDSMLLTGGPVTQVASFASNGGSALGLFGGYVYYSTTDGKLWRAPEDGSAMATTMALASFAATTIAVDATNTYFDDTANNVGFVADTAQNASPTLFLSGQSVGSIALDSVNVYWASTNNPGDIGLQPKGGTTPKTLVMGQVMPGPIATDGISIYWAAADGNIHRAGVDGSNPLTLAINAVNVTAMVVDATNVYWSSPMVVASTAK
jgi:hypothetical protein